MQPELTKIRETLLGLNKPNNTSIKGVILDYLPNSRELKRDLLLFVDQGIIKDMLSNRLYSINYFVQYKKRKLNKALADNSKRDEIINICEFITGKTRLLHNNNYSSLSNPSSAKITATKRFSEILKCYTNLNTITHNNSPANLKANLKKTIAIAGVLLLPIAFSLFIFINRDSLTPEKPMITMINKDENTLYEAGDIYSAGQYLGKITKDGQTKRYALFVNELNVDTLFCSFVDYPNFEYAKNNFAMFRVYGNTYQSKFGKINIKRDTIEIAYQITPDNFEVWTFVKRMN